MAAHSPQGEIAPEDGGPSSYQNSKRLQWFGGSLPANPKEKSSSRQSLPKGLQSVFPLVEETHPEDKPTCTIAEENHTKEKSTQTPILNFE